MVGYGCGRRAAPPRQAMLSAPLGIAMASDARCTSRIRVTTSSVCCTPRGRSPVSRCAVPRLTPSDSRERAGGLAARPAPLRPYALAARPRRPRAATRRVRVDPLLRCIRWIHPLVDVLRDAILIVDTPLHRRQKSNAAGALVCRSSLNALYRTSSRVLAGVGVAVLAGCGLTAFARCRPAARPASGRTSGSPSAACRSRTAAAPGSGRPY